MSPQKHAARDVAFLEKKIQQAEIFLEKLDDHIDLIRALIGKAKGMDSFGPRARGRPTSRMGTSRWRRARK